MRLNTEAALSLILVTPHNLSLFSGETCLSNGFYGSYGAGPTSVFQTDMACIDSFTASSLIEQGSLVMPVDGVSRLVWLEEKAIDDSLKASCHSTTNEFDAFLDRLSTASPDNNPQLGEQTVLGAKGAQVEPQVLYRTQSSALISVGPDTAQNLDALLPRFWKSTPVSSSPVSFIPVPSSAVEHVKQVLSTLKHDSKIASIVNNISVPQMKNDIEFLTGEDSRSGILSRHSFAQGSRTAAAWLKDRFEDTGATCELKPFLTGFAPNVVCRYPATRDTTATVLLSAHYDSRGSFGSSRAPGGDDDGSGTVALLAIARTIARKGIQFHDNVELVAFAGEEQGLYGSRAYSRELRAAGANITLMIQADMLAYHVEGEPPQLGLPDRIGTKEVTQLVANISALYSPELTVGFTLACCSDHQSFHEQGFPATQVFERAGPIADPMYHNSGDLSQRDGYDLEQVKSIAKVQFATLLHAAGFDLSDDIDV